MNLPDVVQAAIRTKLAGEMKPISDTLARLRALLDAYEAQAKLDAERRVSNAMLTALGMPLVEANPAFETVKTDLRQAMVEVFQIVGLPPPPLKEQRTEPEPTIPAPAPSVVPPSAPLVVHPPERVDLASSTPPPRRQLRQEDIALAKRLIAEIEALRPEIKNEHPVRLFPLLQAIVAEIRLLLDRLPEDNYLYERLSQLIPVVGAFKNEGKVEEFIKGLAFGSQGDWERLAYKNRRKVEQYDRDVERSSTPPSQKPKALSPDHRFGTIGDLVKKSKDAPEPAPESNHQWPSLPKLNSLNRPILLAGGLIVPEKIKSVHERFGLHVEWHEIDHDNPRASNALLQRVRAGKVGALIFLEGVMRHSTYKTVVEACNLAHVPYAMGDKAGVASLQHAFAELERKLGC